MGKNHVKDGATFRYPEQYGVDIEAIRKYRLERVRAQIIKHDLGALLLFDPVNIRYSTDTSNMQIWGMHEAARYVFIPATGPTILFDYHSSSHTAYGLVDEIRPAHTLYYIGSGDRMADNAKIFAGEIADLIKQYCGGNLKLGIDRTVHSAILELMKHDIAALRSPARNGRGAQNQIRCRNYRGQSVN